MNEQKLSGNYVRIAILCMLTAVSIFCEIVFHYWNKIDTGYTQFFYILIITAGIWYQKKAIWIAMFLAAMHLLVTYLLVQSFTWNSIVSSSMFICAAVLVGLLSQETENRQKDLIASKDEIEKKHAALIGYMTEYTLRLKQPIELVLENLRSIHGALSEKPDAGTQDIRDSLMIQIKNTEQIHANLQTINNAVTEERDDIPEVFREFLKR